MSEKIPLKSFAELLAIVDRYTVVDIYDFMTLENFNLLTHTECCTIDFDGYQFAPKHVTVWYLVSALQVAHDRLLRADSPLALTADDAKLIIELLADFEPLRAERNHRLRTSQWLWLN